jgi:hypothetical protein
MARAEKFFIRQRDFFAAQAALFALFAAGFGFDCPLPVRLIKRT